MGTYKFEVYPEEHCDDCMEIVHNHFNCPICNEEYSDSDRYSDLTDDFIDNGTVTIKCENCKSTFATSKFSYSTLVEWKLLAASPPQSKEK